MLFSGRKLYVGETFAYILQCKEPLFTLYAHFFIRLFWQLDFNGNTWIIFFFLED